MQVSARTCSDFLVGCELLDFNILSLLCVFFYFFFFLLSWGMENNPNASKMYQKMVYALKHYCTEIRSGKHLGKAVGLVFGRIQIWSN